MIPIRAVPGVLTLAAVCLACENTEPRASVALAGVGLAGTSRASETPVWQRTVVRRVRWGRDTDPLVSPFPDGERMAVTDWATGDVAVYDIERRELTRLTEQSAPFAEGMAMYPVVSPDGGRVAYAWDGMENSRGLELRVVGAGNGASELLYRGPEAQWIHAVDWSPDGSSILVYRWTDAVDEIAMVTPVDGSVTVLKTLGLQKWAYARFSPDGRFVAYDYPTARDSNERDIHVLAVDGTSEGVLIDGPANDRLLGWAPDGRSVLFLSDRTGTPGAWLVPVAGGRPTGEPVLVKPDMWAVEPNGFTPDGRFFYTVAVGARAMKEVTLSADGRSLATAPLDLSSRIHRQVRHPRWSPDGQFIAFVTMSQGQPPALRLRSVESGEEREVGLDRRLRLFVDLDWLPDNRSIVAVVRDEEGPQPNAIVVIVDARTGETTDLVVPGPDEFVSGVTVSPDGRTVYYSITHSGPTPAESGVRIVSHAMSTGAEQILLDTRTYVRSLSVSPDGTTLAFGSGDEDDALVYLLPTSGGTPRTLGVGATRQLGWAPDGRAILFTSPAEDTGGMNPLMRLLRLDIASGEATPVGLEERSLGVIGGFDIHPGNRRMLFTSGAPEFEWWVMEQFLDSSARED